ncbi:adhesin [Avibacterium sp. 21-586]|uniref:UDP-glucose:protein N-beta-glucosyltransferase n=1 Tax=Avibacterium sp. 21-586 TaxID=2911534 RepID=UPI002247C290|nr:adhesin [Avibacterium sp. 21-586]MCW9711222.1 adhesin [Avibacterium sp. 21-586]
MAKTELLTSPSLQLLEKHIHHHNYEQACNELLAILYKLDADFGTVDQIAFDYPIQLNNLEQDRYIFFCTRMADAITRLFTQPDLTITQTGFANFIVAQRWIALIFASSPYINADHILETYNQQSAENQNPSNIVYLNNSFSSLAKFCILYLPESNVYLDLEIIWQINQYVCTSLCFALQSPRFIGTKTAFDKRAKILQWLPEKLIQLENLDKIPSKIIHDVYMHCSYDIATNKHQIKHSVNQVIRSHLLQLGWQDRDISQIGEHNGKPVMIVLLEHFNAVHSIYRTHSTSLIAAKAHFYLIGLGNSKVDKIGRDVFDEFHEITNDKDILGKLLLIKDICEQFKASVLYMPSIGMDLLTIFASNTRLAPIQAIALGHPATTHSDYIDYVIVEDDYVGSEDCFSEVLLRLPKDALPYVPSALAPTQVHYNLRQKPEVVQIGIASTTMKLNPYFLEACQIIRDRANVKIHFHFALGLSLGITHPYVERFIKSYLGKDATVYTHQPYNAYLSVLHQCDMMINPFPFGNTNGIIDMVTLGLVGVCKTGDEVHEHIDEGLFKRLGLPEWLITHSIDEYIACAIRLAENHDERLALRHDIISNNRLASLFQGNPEPMGQILLAKVNKLKNN